MLADDGELYTSIPNVQHYSIFRNLLKGDFQYRSTGLLDSTHLRFFCLANIDKLMLDAGFEPRLHNRVLKEDPALEKEFAQVLRNTGIDQANLENMRTFQYQTRARKTRLREDAPIVPMTFIVHCRFPGVLKDNFYSSPVFSGNHPHQIMAFRNNLTLAEAWRTGLGKARHEYVVLIREEVYLPAHWDARLVPIIEQMEMEAASDWIAGCGPCRFTEKPGTAIGSLLRPGEMSYRCGELVSKVDTLDDAVLIAPRDNALNIDIQLGDQLHGVDLALGAQTRGQSVFAIHNPCLFNSIYIDRKPTGYQASTDAIRKKWPQWAGDISS